MNASAERIALSLTALGLIGIIIRVICLLPIRLEMPHAVESITVGVLIACCFIGPIASLAGLIFIQIKSDLIRPKVAGACNICNVIWLAYIGYCLTHFNGFGIQH